jgi:hypothetical protein
MADLGERREPDAATLEPPEPGCIRPRVQWVPCNYRSISRLEVLLAGLPKHEDILFGEVPEGDDEVQRLAKALGVGGADLMGLR